MARGDKNYDKRTHKVVDKSSDTKKKEVWNMVGKKKLHEMVEALIGGDSKTAAAALHEYLQQKTRSILGEMDDMDFSMDDEHGDEEGSEHGEFDDEFGDEEFDGEEHGEEGECPECHCDPCECEGGEEHDEFGEEGEGGEGHEEHGFEEPVHESNLTKAKHNHFEKNTAKLLDRKVKGNVKFDTHGKAKLTKPHNNAAPHLDRKVKGDVKFKTHGKAKLTKPHNNAAPGLDRKVKGEVKF